VLTTKNTLTNESALILNMMKLADSHTYAAQKCYFNDLLGKVFHENER